MAGVFRHRIPTHTHAMFPIRSYHIDYKSDVSPLCMIGRKYDTDKSSQRDNVTHSRHCHPYTLFYHSLFQSQRKETMEIAELGILNGASLLMWREYFPNAAIDGFDYDLGLLHKFREGYDQTRIALHHINVKQPGNVSDTFRILGNKRYELIIEDTTHEFDDQIRVVDEVWPYLKEGGILIIEDIFKRYNEADYATQLAPIMEKYNAMDTVMYFVTLDHVNRVSTGWDNDKLLIIQKGGAKPFWANNHKMTIITPSCRPENLMKVYASLDFNYVERWVIVYDGGKVPTNPHQFANIPKIEEHVHEGSGLAGNAQRNYALRLLGDYPDTLLYFLDDDNIVHPELYWLLRVSQRGRMYTFDRENGLDGDHVELNKIDTAMVLMDAELCKGMEWDIHKYNADGFFITGVYAQHREKHVYVNNGLCYYNKLSQK